MTEHTPLAERFERARRVITGGLDAGAFPGASVSVGARRGAQWEEAFGRLTCAQTAPACSSDTIYDLASLTKVIVTTSLAMRLIAAGKLGLDTTAESVLPGWDRDDRSAISVRHLLEHTSGLPAHLRLWDEAQGRDAYLAAITAAPLEHAPGTAAVYSDPGFILLGLILERVGGETLDRQFAPMAKAIGGPLLFRPLASLYERIAPTEFDPWRGRMLCGEVHDENAAAMGGVAGHAGLFGSAPAVGAFARLVMETFERPTILGTPDLMRTFAARSAVPASSRALGWDTALPTSSSGARMSPTAIGHTGFTGTSLWIDWERDLYAVLLTNRVHPTRENEQLIPLRARFHDALSG